MNFEKLISGLQIKKGFTFLCDNHLLRGLQCFTAAVIQRGPKKIVWNVINCFEPYLVQIIALIAFEWSVELVPQILYDTQFWWPLW